MSRINKQDLQDWQDMSRINKRRNTKQDFQDYQDCQDEEENVGERQSLILFIVLILKILLGIKKPSIDGCFLILRILLIVSRIIGLTGFTREEVIVHERLTLHLANLVNLENPAPAWD